MVKSASGKCHVSQVLGTIIAGLSLCGKEKLTSFFVSRSTGMESGSDSTGEVQGPTLQGENLRSGLNWLYMAMALLKTLFCEREFFSKVKT
jgi:hypothetical protein